MTSDAARALVLDAFRDRHLARHALSVHQGGLAESCARYAQEPSPPLLIVESGPDEDLDARLDALAEVCEPGTNLILLGSKNDVETYRMLTRRGVGDYVVLPAPPARLVESVLDLYQEPGKAPVGIAIAVLGTRGGSGASTLAHNLAVHLAQRDDADVAVLDLDLAFGCGDISYNVETANGVRNLLAEPDRIDEVFLQRFSAKYGERVQLLAAPAALDGDGGIDPRALEASVTALKRHAKYVVLDLPHLWGEWMRTALALADKVALVATPDLPSVRNTRNLVDFLAQTRPLEGPPLLVLNRVGQSKNGEVPTKEFGQTVGLQPGVVLANDPETFGLAASHGRMVEELRPKSRAAQAIRDAAAALVPPRGRGAAAGSGKGDPLAFLRRIAKRA